MNELKKKKKKRYDGLKERIEIKKVDRDNESEKL